ncbi:MAG: BolA/IbaG family iron-sulfur metabolism protein [Pseudomonadota bacterium]
MVVQKRIEEQLQANLLPVHLEVDNESHQHSVPDNSETHFRVVVVSEVFDGLRKVARHQRIYQLLASELDGPVHALALHTYTPHEWSERHESAPDSPNCLGGSKAEQT